MHVTKNTMLVCLFIVFIQKPKEKISKKKDILSKDLSLVKRFSQLTDEERKDLIKRAFEEKMKLQQELEEAKKIAEDKSRELEQLQKQVNFLMTFL